MESLRGSPLRSESAAGVKINGVNVVKANVLCSNGIIHVVDAVLLPKNPGVQLVGTRSEE